MSVAIGLLALGPPAAAQEEQPSAMTRFFDAMNESSPVGMLAPDERTPGWKGWFADAWEGSKRIFRQGHNDLLLPFHTFHPAFRYPNRGDQNHYPWGVGIASTVIDAKDNERIVYALGFSDSHYDFQPMVGYGWMARWPLAAGLKWGLGYTVLLTARADAAYIPIPGALPLASIGTDRVMVYGTWIPTTDVLFFFARISLPDRESTPDPRGAPGAGMPFGASPDGRRRGNLIYAQGAWVNTDASGIDSVASGNGWAPVIGYRHFVTDAMAFDVSVARSNLSLDLYGSRLGTFDFVPVTFAAQYHFAPYYGLRMYAGAGVAYNQLRQRDLPGYTLSSSSISPVLQAGATLPLTDALVLTGGMSVNFARHQLAQGDTTLGTVKLSPATFGLGLGFAF